MTRQTESGGVSDSVRPGPKHVCVYCTAVKTRYEHGMAVPDIARDLGIPYGSARFALLRHGITPEPRRPRRDTKHACTDRCAAIIAGYRDEGLSLEAVGLKHGLTRERVRQILASHKVPKRYGSAAHVAHRGHECDDICAVLLAAPPPVSAMRIADANAWPLHSVDYRIKAHKIPTKRYGPGHICADRCQAMVAYLDAHPEATVYSAARLTGTPYSWAGQTFRTHHQSHWRVTPFKVIAGRRVSVRTAK